MVHLQGVMKLDVNTFLMDMDVLIPEHVIANSDGSYTVLLNSRLSRERQLEAFSHAMKHIERNDFEKTDADNIELIAHDLEIAKEICFV